MTFEARELSAELGAPILLVTFALGPVTWRQAQADQAVVHGGNTYQAMGPLEVSRIQESNETRKNDVTLQVDRGHPIAELWRLSPPTDTVAVVLREIHQDEAEDAIAWLGHVSNVAWDDKGKASITLSPGAMAMRSNGLRRLWQKGCAHVFYGPRCKLAKATLQHAVTITSNTGQTLTAAGFAAAGARFHGGWVEWVNADGVTERRFITAHNGTVVAIMGPATGLAVGTVCQAFEGCDHSLARCAELGNTDNYGGVPYFLGKNPFDGQPVY